MRFEQSGPVLVAAAALCCWPLSLLASPFEVPDVDPEEHLELKTTLERDSSGDEREWDAPQFELTFPARPDVEVSVEAGYAIAEFDGQTHSGFSDTEINAKWRFQRQSPDSRRPTLTLQPAVTFATGDEARGLGDEESTYSLGLLGARSFGALEVHSRIGYERTFSGDEDEVFGSALLLLRVSEDVRVGAELAGDGGPLHLRGNLGVKWEVSENIELQALVGRTLENRDGPPVTRAKLVLEYEFE